MDNTKTFLNRVKGTDCMVDTEDDQENTGSKSPQSLGTKHDKVRKKKQDGRSRFKTGKGRKLEAE
jgi:hypothetical protein